MRLLLLTYHYAPKIHPRAFRWAALAEWWARQGHRVEVVSSWAPGVEREEELNGVRVHRVGGGILGSLRGGRSSASGAASSASGRRPHPSPGGGVDLKASRLAWMARWAYDHTWKRVYWPDYACCWYFPSVRKAQQRLEKGRFDALVSVSDPFTAHLAGWRIVCRHPYFRWLVDISDPFCFHYRETLGSPAWYRKLDHWAEERVFQRADAVAVTTQATRKRYAELFPESASKIHVLPHLMAPAGEEIGAPSPFPKDSKIRLVYVGSLWLNERTPDFLLSLFVRLLETSLKERLELHFFGNINDCEASFKSVEGWLGDKIVLHGLVPRGRVLQAMRGADVLVNIGNKASYQQPSKLVEYAQSGKPVLNVAPREDDSSAEFFKDYPAAFMLSEEGLAAQPARFATLLRFLESPPKVPGEALKRWRTEFSLEAVASVYQSLLTG